MWFGYGIPIKKVEPCKFVIHNPTRGYWNVNGWVKESKEATMFNTHLEATKGALPECGEVVEEYQS